MHHGWSTKQSKVVKEINLFRQKIRHITEGTEARSQEIRRPRQQVVRRPSMSDFVSDDFVGREGDIKILVAMLLEDNQRGIVSICGMGGLGKTTLAKKVCKHDDVRRVFKGFSVVHISQNFNITTVLIQILTELALARRKEDMKAMSDSTILCEKIHKLLKDNKFLVVIDDLWTLEDWNVISPAFPILDMQSKILITTRIRTVAYLGGCYDLRCLSEEESWDLFQKKALPNMETEGLSSYTEMEKIGRKLVERCKGLPLAVLVLRGFMVTKHSLTEWERVYNRLNFYHGGKELVQVDKEVSRVLSFSYSELPYKLKPCFLFLASSTKFDDNWTQDLYEMWISEGLIRLGDLKEGETMMDVAKRYMTELVDRSMVEVQCDLSVSRIEFCEQHDVMRELCMSKAEEDKFTTMMDFTLKGQEAMESLSINTDAHRLSLILDENACTRIVTPKKETTRQLRLLHLKRRFFSCMKWPKEAFHFNEFKFLRELRIEGHDFGSGNILKGIGQLIHLRYLCFMGCRSGKLPSSIGNLVYLQVVILDIYDDPKVQTIIWKSRRLYHLYLPHVSNKGGNKLSLNSLLNLEILENFDPQVWDVKDFFNLTCLRKLTATISDLKYLAVMMSYLASISSEHLGEFSLTIWCNFDSEEGESLLTQLFECNRVHQIRLNGHIRKFPAMNISISHSIIEVRLAFCQLEEDPLTRLENLPNLIDLQLWSDSFMGKEMTCSQLGFPKLKFFDLRDLSNLENLMIDQGGMPTLSAIQIDGCNKLKMLPEGFRFITSLNEVIVIEMAESFTRRMQVINGHEGEDFYKVRHVPSIIIQSSSQM